MDKDGFRSVKVLVVVEGDVICSVEVTPHESEGTDVNLGYCCDSCLVGSDAALAFAVDAVRFQLWKSGLAFHPPEGISPKEEEPPF